MDLEVVGDPEAEVAQDEEGDDLRDAMFAGWWPEGDWLTATIMEGGGRSKGPSEGREEEQHLPPRLPLGELLIHTLVLQVGYEQQLQVDLN